MESIGVIPTGSPITDNYGPIFTKFRKEERKHKLRGRYWFQCACQACTEDWQLLEDLPTEIQPTDAKERKAQSQLENLLSNYFEKALELMDQGKGLFAIQLLKKYLDEAEPLVGSIPNFCPYKTIQLAQEALKICMAAKGTVHVVPIKN